MSAIPPEAARRSSPKARPAATPARPIRPAPELPEAPDAPAWLTPEFYRGWGSSVALHAVLLLVMGLWYFAPSVRRERVFDTRIAGSENGVEGGQNLTGGLNTPIEFERSLSPTPQFDPNVASIKPLDLSESLATLATPNLASKPSAGGGMNNPNPGAGDGDGFGLARFGNGGELIQGIAVKVGDPQFTLIWDTEVDLDLHVVEPGGKEIWWEEPRGKRGGELDVDNTRGYGPENIYWLKEDEEGRKVKGAGPPGEYQWFVVYWGGFGGVPKPTNWKVRIKHGGKVTVKTGKFRSLNERSRTYTLQVAPEGKNVGGNDAAP